VSGRRHEVEVAGYVEIAHVDLHSSATQPNRPCFAPGHPGLSGTYCSTIIQLVECGATRYFNDGDAEFVDSDERRPPAFSSGLVTTNAQVQHGNAQRARLTLTPMRNRRIRGVKNFRQQRPAVGLRDAKAYLQR
jgi:hypothetical protein